MSLEGNQIILAINGLGIIFYSPSFVSHIARGADYLTTKYTAERDVQEHIQKGSIVGFDTSTPGTFILRFHDGYPNEEAIKACEFKLRLGLHCQGGLVCFRDLYDLMDWQPECPAEQTIELNDGFYHVTLCSDAPESGILGDNQTIDVFFQKLEAFPTLAKHGIPTLCV